MECPLGAEIARSVESADLVMYGMSSGIIPEQRVQPVVFQVRLFHSVAVVRLCSL